MAVKQRGEPDPPLEGIAHTKLRQFAAEVVAMEVSELLDIAQLGRRQTLLLTLLRQARRVNQDEWRWCTCSVQGWQDALPLSGSEQPDAAQTQRRSPSPHPEDGVQGAELAGL